MSECAFTKFQVKDMCIYTGPADNPESKRKVCRIVNIKDPKTWQDKRVPEYQIVLLVGEQVVDAKETELEEIR